MAIGQFSVNYNSVFRYCDYIFCMLLF